MNIVTGYRGSPHVTSNAAQAFNQGIFGQFNNVLEVGNKFSATITDANTVTILDGEGVIQGVHFRIDPGTTETVNIANGTTGYNRKDLICARYTKNAITGVEDVSLVVVEGTPSESSAAVPAVNTGDVLAGDSPVDFPLYRVDLSGLTPTLTRVAQSISLVKLGATPLSYTGLNTNEIEVYVIPQFHFCIVQVHLIPQSDIPAQQELVQNLPRPYTPEIGGVLYKLDRTILGQCSITNDGTIQFCAITRGGNQFVCLAYFYRDLDPLFPLSSGTLVT